jgi:hypothetical protein
VLDVDRLDDGVAAGLDDPVPAATATRHTSIPEVKPRFFMSEGLMSGWVAVR